jgi:hypothetical protein
VGLRVQSESAGGSGDSVGCIDEGKSLGDNGFQLCCPATHTPCTHLFTYYRPAELEQLVCGGRVVDLSALEAATNYDDGYHRNSKPVRWFWEVSVF